MYEGLDGAEAAALAEKLFGIQRPSWRPPGAEPGASVERYVNSHVAVEVSAGGKHLVDESTIPLLSSVGLGSQAPTSMTLQQHGGVFTPANPVVPVSISASAAGGVELPYGFGFAPVQAATGELGRVVGDHVFFGSTATDTDFMVEPIAGGEGVEASWILRSAKSPETNVLAFSLPTGASLALSSTEPGGAEVVSEGQTVLRILPALARQADGVPLPVSYSINKDVLSTHVDVSGSVDFPVMVDPTVVGSFGEAGFGHWYEWGFSSACGCVGSTQNSKLLRAGTNPGPANGSWGGWYLDAPGWNNAHGSRITRVWTGSMAHGPANQSSIQSAINEVQVLSGKLEESSWVKTESAKPVWTNDGDVKADTKPAPLNRLEEFDEDVEFCADGAGGSWTETQPLCNEEYGGEDFSFALVLGPNERTVYNYAQVQGVSVVLRDEYAPNEVAIENLPTKWVQHPPTDIYIHAHDEGVGIQDFQLEVPPGHLNSKGQPFFVEEGNCGEELCPQSAKSADITELAGLETGVWALGATAWDAAGNFRELQPAPHLYVDDTSPQIEPLSGSLVENSSKVGAGDYTLNFEAVDGSVSAPQSGMRKFTVAVDGNKVDEVSTSCPEPTGVPAAGCFGFRGSWTMEGERYGAGPHTVTVTATDWAGNESTKTLHITSDEASYSPLGPGMVNLQTGDFKLAAADVQVAAPGAALSLTRLYESRNPSAGSGGPLGPQWSLSLPDSAAAGVWQSLHVEPNGNVAATLASGARVSFAPSGGGYTSPAGFQTESLKGLPSEKPSEFRLTNAAGDQTIFKHAEHEEEGLYTPVGVVQASGAGGLNQVSYTFEKTSEGVVQPTAVIAPSPPKLKCAEEFVQGCRKLTFNYASSTTAMGEGPEEWGDYKGRLTRVYLHAWNPKAGEKGEMSTTTVAQYAYDTKGRLRAEWNPQVSPALKTEYGYDEEGHVTAVTAPGQQTWALTYGTVNGDSNGGRLIKALQAPASTSLWKGEPVSNSEAPKLSGSPVVGVRMAVSQGKWSGGPVAYAYRWEQCNATGAECAVIPGADNANYAPAASVAGHTVRGQVIATNGGGSVIATSSAETVWAHPGEHISQYSLSVPFECPGSITTGSDGNMWFVDCNHQLGKITPGGSVSDYSLGSGTCSENSIASGSDGNLWVAEGCANKIVKINTKGEVLNEYSLPSKSGPATIVSGPEKDLWFTEEGTSKIAKITTGGEVSEYSAASDSQPDGITVGKEGDLWFTEWAGGKIAKMTTSGTFTEYALPGGGEPGQIATDAAGNLWFTEGGESAKIGKITTGGTITEYSLPGGSRASGIAAGPEGNMHFAAGGAIGTITPGGAVNEYSLPAESSADRIAMGPNEQVWFTETDSDSIGTVSTPSFTQYNLPSSFACPKEMTAGPEKSVWFADECKHEVGKINTSGEVSTYEFPSGVCLDGITEGSDGNLWVAEGCPNKIAKMTPSGTITTYNLPTGSDPEGMAEGAEGDVWFTNHGDNKIGKITTSGTVTEYPLAVSGEPWGITEGSDGNMWFTEEGGNRIGKITPAGAITEYLLPSESAPISIAAGSDKNLWFTELHANMIGKITTGGEITEYSLAKYVQPREITNGPEGNLWFTTGGEELGMITPAGSILEYQTPFADDTAWGIAKSSNGKILFLNSSSVGSITPPEITEGETQPAQPGWTIEYNVPTSSNGAPHEMSSYSVSKWAQKDDPVSATAILPPDKPQSWPASSYQHSTIYYLDGQEHTVNVANPGGGISTTEYNASNGNVERTLSADDRAIAINESKPGEVAEHLSTESKYNSEGTELTSTLGPEHKVKLSGSHEEVSARKHTTYSYNEGAPSEGGPYYLVTKTVEKAKLASGEEKDERAVSTSYSGQEGLGWKLDAPTSTTTAPGGLGLTHTTLYSPTTGAQVETRSPSSPPISEYALPSGSEPFDITVGSDKNLWFTNYGTGKVGKITTAGTIKEYAAEKDEPEGITAGPDGNLWFVEHTIRHVNHITTSGELTVYTLTRTGTYNVGITSGPDSNLWFTESSSNYIGKINTKDEVQGEYALPTSSEPNGITAGPEKDLWFTDYGTSKIGKITTSGTITEYTLPAGSRPYSIVEGPDGNLWFTEPVVNKIVKMTTTGSLTEYALPSGSEPSGITAGPEKDLWATERGTSKIAKITTGGEVSEYTLPSGSKPQGIVAGPEGNLWFAEEGTSKIGKLNPTVATGNQEARNSQTVFYSTGTEAGVAACENHPEWANLPCQTQPAHQPETAGLPELPITTYTYNLYGEPEVTKSTSGSSTRTETDSYDAAGHLTSKELTSTVGASMPKVTYEYNKETGLLEKQKAGEHTITSIYNTHGQLTSYTDGEEGTTTYKYDIDGRTTEQATPFGSQTFTYNETTGQISKLVDSAGGTFTASYDQEGDLTSETLPDGLTACYTHNATGEPTGLEYRKSSGCETGSVWFSDSTTSTIHGQWASQTSSFSNETYGYDEAGHLTEVQETPSGKGCTVRLYAYEEAGNRTSMTTREPGGEGKCATEGGTVKTHSYDTANRLTDTGVEYSPFGDITGLPASDAGGSTLESVFYTDGQVAEQRQEGVTLGYQLDPARRISEITTTSSKGASTLINHYAGEGATPAWTSETGGKWTRYIYGIGGGLAAIQTDSETPVLQLSNLHGDIIATAADEESASKLLSSTNTTEYGVPTTASPSRYSWLGTQELPTEFPSGVIAMGARSYVPQLGRFLQPDPQPGGSENAYAYTHGNPLNETDPSGEWSLNETSGGLSAVGTGEGQQIAGGTGVAEGAITPPPVNAQVEAAFWASPPWDQITAGNEEYEEYGEYSEEEGGEEYASYHQGGEAGPEAQVEPGLLEKSDAEGGNRNVVQSCGTDSEVFMALPCARDVGILGDLEKAWHWVKHNIHKLVAVGVGAISTLVVGGATLLATTGCAASAAVSADPFEAFDCYKIAAFGVNLTFAVAASTYEAWKQVKK
ncbi:MAG TPA: RHS repeat-associated core domain-containing protein [Solirubrobacteraceae bacterium]|nr:RHS repeat-associated core domain-containing protein [Solirubrobacteraceae bacterium]